MAEVISQRKRQYKDISLTFARNPVTADIVAVTDAEAVKRAIKMILLTNVGEVPFFPSFGSRMAYLLFEPIDPITTAAMDDEIRASIKAFEPRARIKVLTITPTEDEHQYQIDITFALVNLLDPITLTLFLTRLR